MKHHLLRQFLVLLTSLPLLGMVSCRNPKSSSQHVLCEQPLDLAATKHTCSGADLEGLERYARLETLVLFNAEALKHPLPLLFTTSVKTLVIRDDLPKDMPALVNTSIRRVEIGDWRGIDGICQLAGLVSLRELTIAPKLLADLTPLKCLPRLERLTVRHAKVTSLNGIEQLTRLKTVEFEGKLPTDLRPLSALRRLHSITFQHDTLKDVRLDLAPLAALTSLRVLRLGFTSIVNNLERLGHLERMQELWLGRLERNPPPTQQFPALRALRLRTLDCDRTLDTLAAPALQTLWLSCRSEKTVHFSKLAPLRSLKRLVVGSKRFAELVRLRELPSLRSLELLVWGTVDLSGLKAATRVRDLALWLSSDMTSLASLAELTHLTQLTLSSVGGVRDFRPIAKLTNLRALVVRDPRANLGAVIGKLPHLERLTVVWRHERCVGPFVTHPTLRHQRILYPSRLSRLARNRLNEVFEPDNQAFAWTRRIDPRTKRPLVRDGSCP